jgi:hypothetical protein
MRHRRAAGGAPQQPLQQRTVAVSDLAAAAAPVPLQHRLHPFKHGSLDDRLVLAVEDLVLVPDLPGVQGVREQPVQVALVEGEAANGAPGAGYPRLGPPASAVQLLHDRQQRAPVYI